MYKFMRVTDADAGLVIRLQDAMNDAYTKAKVNLSNVDPDNEATPYAIGIYITEEGNGDKFLYMTDEAVKIADEHGIILPSETEVQELPAGVTKVYYASYHR